METCDVLIVGGGPAGSTCAWRLKQAGFDVMVMDKREFPRDKVCAGWITPAVLNELQVDLEDYAKERILQPITGFITAIDGGEIVETNYGYPVSYGIRRCEFDHYLLSRSGARLHLGQPFKQLRRENEQWIVNDQISTPLVIGAGGHFCPVARQLGAKLGSTEPVVAAQEIEFLMDEQQQAQCRVAAEKPELYFCADLKGYGWCFRKGNYLNIGLGRQDNRNLSDQVAEFVATLQRHKRIPDNIPNKFHGHAYLLHGEATRRIYDHGLLLIGDAAGLAYPQSGEGIRPAIESGLLAAQTLIAAQGDYSRTQLARYAQLLDNRLGKRETQKMNPLLEKTVSRVNQALAKVLLTSQWFSRYVVLDRWFLHRSVKELKI
jgi:geranylgeranyl reductase family protein